MRLTQTINTRDTEIGSFLPTNKLKPRQVISNIIMQNGQQAQYIRAPGTFARVVDIEPRLKLQLTRKRSIILANT
jgi:ribosomal protein L2